MWNIEKTVSKGQYLYAVIKEHPNATKHGYVLYHRALMENKLKRLLEQHEIVHHKDHNKLNNDINNLELLNYKEHSKLHGLHKKRWYVDLVCPICKSFFTKPKNTTHLQKPSKLNCTCCSPSCRGKLSAMSQINKITEQIQENINNNITNIYRKQTGSS